jgi:hypothetical protein
MDVIITVPHSACVPQAAQRTCDVRARSAAQIIHTRLARLPAPAYRVSIAYANSFRFKGDLNRRVTRGWAWRKHVQSMVEHGIKRRRKVMLFDIHSFPNTKKSFGLDRRTGDVPHVVLLDYMHRHENIGLPSTLVMQASKANDIVVQTIEAGGDALLLEFNEDKTHTPDRYVAAVAIALEKMVKNV